jgi:hypothetical protein
MCKVMFIITHVNGVYDLQFDKQKNTFILMNKKNSQIILHGDT